MGFGELDCLPKAVVMFCCDAKAAIVSEANKLGVPVVGVADSTLNVRGIDYVVPICSSSGAADLFVCKLLAGVCSAASMVCDRSRSISTAMKLRIPSASFRADYKLLVAWLHFKAAFLESASGRTDLSSEVAALISYVKRVLDVKLVFGSLLSWKLSPTTPLIKIIR